MLHLQILTDGSVNTKLKVGYGTYFVASSMNVSIDLLKDTVKVKHFLQTSSTRLELQILLWALSEMVALANRSDIVLTVYTDSQNIISLPGRCDRLEQSNYFSDKNKRLNNYRLYQEFYRLTSRLNYRFIKVVDHKVSGKKDKIDRLFGLVNQASRRALREDFRVQFRGGLKCEW